MGRYPTTPMCDGALLEAFEPTTRDTDVFVTAAAKCGQTWTLALLHHLRTGGRDPGFGGVGALGVTPWLENPRDMTTFRPYDRADRLRDLAAMADPRVFKMHVTWEEVPRPAGSRSKVIVLSRDARDVPWSLHSHLKGLDPAVTGQTFDAPFDAWFDGWLKGAYYFTAIRSYWAHRGDPDQLWVRYEDLKADLAGEARRIVAWLGWDVSEDALQRAVALSQLEAMQSSEAAMGMATAFQKGHRFVREGGTGKNRARLTAEQEERIVAKARAELEPACFALVMALGG